MLRFLLSILLCVFTLTGYSQQVLDSLGLSGIRFGMSEQELKNSVIILDTSSAYKDTAVYIRNTTCHNYFRTNETLQLKGFLAGHIEYRFCDGKLAFIFIDVKGAQHVSDALIRLSKLYPKLQLQLSKNPALASFDVTRNNVRMIGTVNAARDQLSFVLISKKTANK
jgi:hypothetical protein